MSLAELMIIILSSFQAGRGKLMPETVIAGKPANIGAFAPIVKEFLPFGIA